MSILSRCVLGALLVAAGLSCACSSPPPPMIPPPQPAEDPAEVTWNMEPGGIFVAIDAQEDLNMARNESHAVTLCIMQLPSQDEFMARIAAPGGLEDILQCLPKPPGVIAARKLYIQPGKKMELSLDRYEKARYVALAAGFDAMPQEGASTVVPIPMHTSKERSFIFFSHPVYNAAPMNLAVHLGQASLSAEGAERVDKK